MLWFINTIIIIPPEGTCNKCGYSGQDWAFKYQGLCSKCYKEWKRQKVKELKDLKPKNDIIQVSGDISITRNVKKRLEEESEKVVPKSKLFISDEKWSCYDLITPFVIVLLLYLIKIPLPYNQLLFWSLTLFLGLIIGYIFEKIAS